MNKKIETYKMQASMISNKNEEIDEGNLHQ